MSAREIIEKAQTIPFLNVNRLIIVSEFEKTTEKERNKLIPYFENPTSFTWLIFLFNGLFKDSNFIENISIQGQVITFWPLWDNQYKSEALNCLKKLSLTIDDVSLLTLLDHLDGSLYSLHNELDKLAEFIGQRKNILYEDVLKLVGSNKIIDFDSFNFLLVRNGYYALENLEGFSQDKTNFILIFFKLYRFYKVLVKVKEMARHDGNLDSILKAMRVPYKQKRQFIDGQKLKNEKVMLLVNKLIDLDYENKGSAIIQKLLWRYQAYILNYVY